MFSSLAMANRDKLNVVAFENTTTTTINIPRLYLDFLLLLAFAELASVFLILNILLSSLWSEDQKREMEIEIDGGLAKKSWKVNMEYQLY